VCQYESLDRLLHVIRGVARGEMLLPLGETAAVWRLLARGPDPNGNGGAQLLAAPTGCEQEIVVCLSLTTTAVTPPSACAHLPSRSITAISTLPKRLITSAIRAATRRPFSPPRRPQAD
jgi:hypothetical protein